ncbi:MAG: DMT family transporter [Rhodobacter sp.]|nr:DMT family transporter [Rhodobacter sp.]
MAIALQPASPVRHPSAPRRNDSGLGIALMAGGMFLFSAVDTQAKFLTETLHPIQIVWCRQLGLLIGVFVMLGFRGVSILRTDHPGLQITRGALAAGSATIFIVAISYVQLADAVAVSFVAPFIVTLLGAAVLRETVGIRRWSAVTIGFVGTLIVIRPGTGAVHPAVFLVILAATLFALRQIISRALSGSDRTVTTVAYTALVSSFVLSFPLPFVWQWPQSGTEWALLVSIALIAAVAETLVIKALEVAQAVVVAPLQYTLILWSTLYGYLVFADLPDMWTWVGALIIVATGIYTLHRERIASRARR